MQYELNLRDYIRIFQKRRWTIILMPVLAGLLGFFLTPSPPTMYEATGRVRVVSRSRPVDMLLETFYYYEEGNRLDTHAEVMLSREVLKEAAMNLGLIDRLNPDGTPVTDAEIAERPDWIGQLTRLREATTPAVIEGTSILQITVLLPNPDRAVIYLNTLLDTYAEHNDYQVNQEIIESLQFLEQRMQEVQRDLRRADEELAAFMLENADQLSLGSGEISTMQREIQARRSRMSAINAAIALIDQAIAAGEAPPANTLTSFGVDSTTVTPFRNQIADLQQRLTRLLSYQTPASPEVREVEAAIRETAVELRAALQRVRLELERELEALESRFIAMPTNDAELERLRAEVALNRAVHDQVRAELEQATLAEVSKTREIQIIERAIDAVPVTESSRATRGLIAAVIGLLLGVVVALLVETLDTSIGAIADVEALLDLRVIGIIPPIDFDEVRSLIRSNVPKLLDSPDIAHFTSLVTHFDPRSPVAEAYRALRTNIEKAREPVGAKVIMVTSSVLEEGKTTTSANLALTFAQMGRKTMLIAADLRRPDIHRVYGLQKEPGLADILTGSMPWESVSRGLSDILLGELPMDAVMLTPGMDNLHVLPPGSNPLNPAELLSSRSVTPLMQELRDSFDVIIIDTPPIIPVTDSAVLAKHVDGIILVYEVGRVGRDVLKRAKAHFDNVDAEIWGIVMNDVKAEATTTLRDTDYYYYDYRYEDGGQAPSRGILDGIGRAASRLFRRRS